VALLNPSKWAGWRLKHASLSQHHHSTIKRLTLISPVQALFSWKVAHRQYVMPDTLPAKE